MKTIAILLLTFGLATFTALADTIGTPALTAHKVHKAAPQRLKGNVTPEGTPSWYTMDAYIQTGQGTVMFYGLSNQLSFSADKKSVYFRTLFPQQYRELWVKGNISGNTITIDSKQVIATDTFTDEGQTFTVDLQVGEPIFDIMDNIVGVKDVVFRIDGDRIYIDDDQQNPDHAIALYAVEDGEIDLYDWTFCDSFKPYTGTTELVTPPATAEVKSYVYNYKDAHLKDAMDIRRIAVDGTDYYFEGLVPSIGGWTKGTRSGNTINISRAQLLAFDPQILKIAGYRQSDGGRLSDFAFTIGADGTITQQDGDNQFIVCYQTNGQLLDYGRSFTLTPYDENKAVTPYNPVEVHSVYYSELNQHGIEFTQYPMDANGDMLSTTQLGYYIYVDGQRYTFTKKQYPYLSWDSADYIPFAYCDDYNYGDIFNDGYYNVVLFYFNDYETLGVQAVYRAGGVETRSDIITVNKANIVDIVPDGIAAPTISSLLSPSSSLSHDIYGRLLGKAPHHGVVIQSGRKTLMK